ncbi:sensor histidine kinase [Clostridium polynesiense]|uniref:sensor histidine kinase n=1 Tax=Clostridium polynesiense TaxID=1325933 RepID=UPI0011C9F1A1|nr:ATP-binding protein [Clostridium polynesiense]
MLLITIFDLLTTILQSLLFVWICNNITSKGNKLSKIHQGILITLLFANSILFTHGIIEIPYGSLIMILTALTFILLFYRKSMIDGLLGFGLTHLMLTIISYILLSVYKAVIFKYNPGFSEEFSLIFLVFIPAWMIYALIYLFRKQFFDLIIALKSIRPSLIFVLQLNYVLIIADTLRSYWQAQGMFLSMKNGIYVIGLIAFMFAIVYFAKINDNAREVTMLNAALNDKIAELKKLKHDYGSEISGLYGLYQLGKIDRMGHMLKNIVNRYNSLTTALNINIESTPMVASVLNSAVASGIDIMVYDSGEYEHLNISDNDLLKVLSNIVNNSIEALKEVENPIIKFKSYNNYSGIVIIITNNGPEIPKEIQDNMFEAAFTTKDNKTGDRGYGLNIVREIMNKCNGKITVDSNKEWTYFRIEIPNKK